MKPALKKARITFLVLSSVMFVCWAALIIVLAATLSRPIASEAPSLTLANFLNTIWQQVIYAFKFSKISNALYVDLALKIPAFTNPTLLDSFVAVSVTGVFGLLAIATLIVAIAKKRFGFITYFILILVFALPAIQFGSYLSQYFVYFKASGLTNKIVVFATFGVSVLSILFSLIFAIIVPFSVVSKKVKNEYLAKEKERKERIAAGLPAIPRPEFVAEPEPTEPQLSKFELANLIREIVRDEVARSELSRQASAAPIVINQPTPEKTTREGEPVSSVHTVTGATFGGPLVVQYFYGVAPTAAPQPQPEVKVEPAPVEEIKEEPVVEETPVVKEEPVVEETPVVDQTPVVEPTPVVEETTTPEPVVVPAEETPVVEIPVEAKKPIIRIPFEERIVGADKAMKENYNILKNEILAYGVKSRISNSGDTFRLHRKTYVKITVAGKSLKLYLALDPMDYADTTIPHSDAGDKGVYAEIPFVFKVKSELSMKRAKQLIQDVMSKDGLTQGEVESVNWVKEIKASLKAAK